MDQKSSQIRIATFADAEQSRFPATPMLSGYEARPGGELPAVFKNLSVAHGRNKSCCHQRTDSFHRCDSLAGLAGLIDGPDLLVDGLDLFFQRQQFVIERSKQASAESGQLVSRILEDERQAAPQLADMLGQDDSVFGQQAADLIGQLRPRAYQAAPHAVQ